MCFDLPFFCQDSAYTLRDIPDKKGLAMTSLPRVALGALAAACCFASVAALARPYDSTMQRTRVEVRAEVIEWRQAGYDQSDDWSHYPESALRAAAIVAQRRAETATPTGGAPR
jgi:hypothetical protein